MIVYLFVSYLFSFVYCDWTAEWMTPLQQEIKRKHENKVLFKPFNTFQSKTKLPTITELEDNENEQTVFDMLFQQDEDNSNTEIKGKLENLLIKAKTLADFLGNTIRETELRENLLKEAIVNGRHGITIVKVLIQNQVPRWYIVRNGEWSYCDGIIQDNTNFGKHNLFSDMYATPKCIGQKIPIARDPCAFNSIIKYEILPTTKLAEYTEADYLCLNYHFNNSMGHYLSVPKKIVNATCKKGMVRTLEDNIKECGERSLSEYTLYPSRSTSSSALPLEYCTQDPGNRVCKLIVGWNFSNKSLNNFVYLKDDKQFKSYFMDGDSS